MKKIKYMTVLGLLLFGMGTGAAAQTKLLSSRYTIEELDRILIPREEFKPYPTIDERAAWERVDPFLKTFYVGEAEQNLSYAWAPLPATVTLEFVRTGNRTNYENIHFGKRIMLQRFVFAELLENKGRFLDQIMDGIWSICEESYWGVPAHLKHADDGEGLPDVTAPFVDLFAAETGRMLSLMVYLMGNRFDAISPEINERIRLEVEQRVLEPVLTKKHMWMDFASNWNTWICSSWLMTALLSESDDEKRTAAVAKILTCLDTFFDGYPDDGGCDEGPGYWSLAGGAFYESLDMLNRATNGQFDLWDNPKVGNIGRYIMLSRLTRRHIINFADSRSLSAHTSSWIYFCGKMIDDPAMMGYGLFGYENEKAFGDSHLMNRKLDYILRYDELKNTTPAMPFPRDVWMDRIQVMTARDREGTDQGFVVAAKAGSNTEGHNHNDVGSFMVYYNGEPVLIDVGSGTYTARTFNEYRYNIWFNSSAYHNLPVFNGVPQVSRAGTRAQEVNYTQTDSAAQLAMNITPAYPEESGLVSAQRTVRLNRGKNVTVTDQFSLKNAGNVTENYMVCVRPDISRQGRILIPAGNEALTMHYDARMFEAKVEKMELDQPEDIGVQAAWGDDIYRISLISRENLRSGKITVRLEK